MAAPPALASPARNPIIFVLLCVLIDTIGFGIILPVLPKLIMQIGGTDIGGAARIGGFLMVVFAGLQFLFGPLMGNLSDAYGRRPILLGSMLAFGVNYALMGFAPSIGFLFIGRALTGISGALYAPANAYIADVTAPEKRAQSFGMVGAAFGLGFVLGPALGGFLGEAGPRAPFFAAAGLACLNTLYGVFVLPESLPKERRRPLSLARANPLGALRTFRAHPRVLRLAVCAFFWQFAFHVYPSTWSYFVIAKFNLTPGMIGATLALSGISMATVQGVLTGRIVKAIGEARAAIIGIVTGVTVFAAYAFTTASWMLWPLLAIGGFQGIAMPSINAMMSKQIEPERQGELQGGMASVMGLASIVGPFTLTQALAQFSGPNARMQFPGASFLVASMLALVCLVLLLSQLGGYAMPTAAAKEVAPGAADT